MWTDRFAILPILDTDLESEGEITYVRDLHILPLSIKNYIATKAVYVNEHGDDIEADAVEVFDGLELYTVLMSKPDFEAYMNEKF